jgi:hypothetical protein
MAMESVAHDLAWLFELFDGNCLNPQVQGFATPPAHLVVATKVMIRSIQVQSGGGKSLVM